MLPAFRRLLAALCRDNSGTLATTFGIALIPLVGVIGAAVDYSNANRIRTMLQAAADAASVGSVATSSTGYNSGASMATDGAINTASKDAVKIFKAEVTGKSGFTLASVKADVEKSKGLVTSTVTFNATVPMTFMKVFGVSSMTVTGTSAAAHDLPVFVDFYLLLDNTPSMGVAATTTDIATMVNNTPDQCAFACHDLSTANNYYTLAKKLGVTTRIDVLRTATQQLMDTATSASVYPGQYRMAIYAFGAAATSIGLSTITSLTSSLSSAKTAAGNLDLMTVPQQNYNSDQDTDFSSVLPAISNVIPTPGDGLSSVTPQKVLFFVTDGVGDASVGGVRTIAPLNPTLCNAIKNRGIRIALLYTTYLPLPTNAFYNTYVAPFSSTISQTMQNCASPGLFFEVSPTQGIQDAMAALFQKVLLQARLTQ